MVPRVYSPHHTLQSFSRAVNLRDQLGTGRRLRPLRCSRGLLIQFVSVLHLNESKRNMPLIERVVSSQRASRRCGGARPLPLSPTLSLHPARFLNEVVNILKIQLCIVSCAGPRTSAASHLWGGPVPVEAGARWVKLLGAQWSVGDRLEFIIAFKCPKERESGVSGSRHERRGRGPRGRWRWGGWEWMLGACGGESSAAHRAGADREMLRVHPSQQG